MRTDEGSAAPSAEIVRDMPDACAPNVHRSLLLEDAFQRARALIDAKYDDFQLTPAAVVQYVGCSRATLYRAFQQHGLTVSGYIQQVRLERVQRGLALVGSRIPISSIAMDCGFECLRHFHRRFKQVFGDTPGAYRHLLHRDAEVKRRHVPD